jgi:hypothetical protein
VSRQSNTTFSDKEQIWADNAANSPFFGNVYVCWASVVGQQNGIVMSYVSGTITAPHVFFTESTNGAATWSTPRAVESAGDRGFYTAPAISPNGTDVYLVYNAFTTPYRTNTTDQRTLVGVVMHLPSGCGERDRGDAARSAAVLPTRLRQRRYLRLQFCPVDGRCTS